MARFYGEVKGASGKAVSRLGSAKSGVEAYAAGHQGAVRAVVYDRDGRDWCRVELTAHQGKGNYKLLYEGPVGEYNPEIGEVL